MSKRGLYYNLVKSQQQSLTPRNISDDIDPVDLLQNDELPSTGSYSFCRSEVDVHQCPRTGSIQNQSQNKFNKNEIDISFWKILLLNKPEWKYLVLGVVGSIILGLSTPVYAIFYGEVMGLLDLTLQQDATHLNNVIALVIYKRKYEINFLT